MATVAAILGPVGARSPESILRQNFGRVPLCPWEGPIRTNLHAAQLSGLIVSGPMRRYLRQITRDPVPVMLQVSVGSTDPQFACPTGNATMVEGYALP